MKPYRAGVGLAGILFALAFFGVGCAATMEGGSPIRRDMETETVSPEFSRDALRSGGISILAILTTGASEGMRQNAAFEIFQGLRASFPEVRVVPRSGAVEKIVSADRGGEYNAFVKNYEERRSMNLDQLREWARIEETRYLLIGAVDVVDKHTESRMTQMGERSVAGRVSVFSSGPNMIPEEVRKRVSLRAEIWDSLCGKAVWIGKSASEAIETAGSEQVRVEDVFISAGRGLSAAMAQAIERPGAERPIERPGAERPIERPGAERPIDGQKGSQKECEAAPSAKTKEEERK